MANALFATAAQGFIDGSIDLDTATIKAALVRGYTFSSSHTFMSDITGAGGTLNGTAQQITGVSVTNGVFNGSSPTTISTTASASNHVIIIFQSSAVTGGADVAASAQRVIAYIDTGTGLPAQPGTGSTPINWDTGTNKIFKVG